MTHFRRLSLPALFLFAMFLLCGGSVASAPIAPPEKDLIVGPAKGPWRRLFLDAMVVEHQEGLARVFHAAERHPANPVVPKDRPWEGTRDRSGPYLYGTVMWDNGKLRMWYHGHRGGAYQNLYAESDDGVTWHKPELGLVEFEGSKANNMFLWFSHKDDIEEPELHRGGGICHNPSVIKRPWEPDPQKRYALFCYGQEYRRSRVAYSPDGFCSMQAGAEEGWLISRREPLVVPKVTINARTEPDGYVVAELLDRDNEVIPGFSREECIPFTGDSTRHVLTWKTQSIPQSHLEGDKKFRFYLKNADLYSYLPDPTQPPAETGSQQ